MAKHTVAYYEKRHIQFDYDDLTDREKERLEEESMDEANEWLDFCKAVDMVKEGWNIMCSYSSGSQYCDMFMEIKRRYDNGENVDSPDFFDTVMNSIN